MILVLVGEVFCEFFWGKKRYGFLVMCCKLNGGLMLGDCVYIEGGFFFYR